MPTRNFDREIINTTSTSTGARGQLSAQSKAERTKGWRLIQCTDVPDELQVFLPPRPAAIYANLLKVEAYALAKNDIEHLKKVRYLKEVMIKKCEKIAEEMAQTSQIGRTATGGLVLEAPLDFRVKRLEQWWEQWESRTKPRHRTRGRAHTARPVAEQTSNRTVVATASGIRTYPQQGKPIAQEQKHATMKGNNERSRYEDAQYDAADEYVMVSPTADSFPAENSSVDKRKTLAPIMVASSSHIKSPQSSPVSNAPQTPVSSSHDASTQINHPQALNSFSSHAQMYQNVPMRPPLLHSPPHQPTPHNIAHSLAVTGTHGLQSGSNGSVPTNGSLRADPSTMRSPVYSANNIHNVRAAVAYGSHPSDTSTSPTKAQGDPSYLRNQFQAAYMAAPSDSSSSPSAVPPPPHLATYGQAHHATAAQNGLQPARTMNRTKAHAASYSAQAVSTPTVNREQRRRATVDGDDTERSVPRPKGYMYASATVQFDAHHLDPYSQSLPQQQSTVAGHSPSILHRLTRTLRHGIPVVGSSSSASSSPKEHDSSRRNAASARRSPSGSPQSQGSYGDNSVNGSRHPQVHIKGSSNLLAPVPVAQALSSPGSNASSADASQSPQYASGARHKLVKRQSNQQMRPKTPERDMQATRGRQPRLEDNENGRSKYAARNPPGTPYHASKVIPDVADFDPPAPNRRDSKYTSGGSSVSEPVIPDPSLIREIKLKKNRSERVRRRLVPLRSSSEESQARYEEMSDASGFTDFESDEDYEGGYYKRPTRSRDGYGSGYVSEADGARPRSLSRPPSRPPSRGILKRSSSVCSQRSNKSVRIEIPKDRRALEEVRDAEEKVDNAEKRLRELLRHPDKHANVADADVMNATAELDEAKCQLREREDAYEIILGKNRRQKSDTEPRYV